MICCASVKIDGPSMITVCKGREREPQRELVARLIEAVNFLFSERSHLSTKTESGQERHLPAMLGLHMHRHAHMHEHLHTCEQTYVHAYQLTIHMGNKNKY